MRRSAGSLVVAAIAAMVAIVPAGADQPAHTHRSDSEDGRQKTQLSTRDWADLELEAEARRDRTARKKAAVPVSLAGRAALAEPEQGRPSTAKWSGRLTFNPENPLLGPNRGRAPCGDDECDEFVLRVPAHAGALYVKAAWERPDYGIYLYAFEPGCNATLDNVGCVQHGEDIQDRGPAYDKRPGNSTTLPVSHLTVAAPKPGEWRIRARAAWGLEIGYAALATVTAERPVRWRREDPRALSRWATQTLDVNLVFAGTTLTREEVRRARALLPDRYQLPVLWWQFSDGGPTDDLTDEINNCMGLVNWTRCHYSGTYNEGQRRDGGHVPFFEPVKMRYRFHFLEADETYTRAAFAAMEKHTKQDQEYHDGGQKSYLLTYHATQGRFRDQQVSDPTRVDLIDAVAVEDWIFRTRFDFCENFTDLETGRVHGAGFVAPDTAARYDPYYDADGRDISRMPQGRNEGVSIFFFDTYSPPFANEYFRPSRYHNFSTFDRYVDPDTGVWDGIDYGRLWGGRYRFVFFDLGAAPNFQESTGWPNGSGGGSADPPRGDPPVWEYRNNPFYRGQFVERAIVRNTTTMLFSRMTSGFLYRPIPRDVYQLTTTNFQDYYSRPPYGTWWTDLTRIYSERLASRWLSAAIPAATFRSGDQIPGFTPYRYLECSDVHVGSKSAATSSAVMLPDPTCAGKEPDPLQKAVELAKAQGDDIAGLGIPFEQAVSATVMRTHWEKNRPTYAPVGRGVYSFVLINAVFEGLYTWYLPAVVGGVAFNTPHRENWGQLQNRNDRRKPSSAHDCDRSRPGAPGCGGVPPLATHEQSGGLTYIVEHEASHGLGLLHPHDFIGVDRDEKGEWNYYYDSMVWMPDSTQSPTTYFASIYPYGVLDQDNLMRGHAGEYIRMAQDAIALAYFEAGRRGVRSIAEAPDVREREDAMHQHLRDGRRSFARGDYLQAEYAFRNAYLAASGVSGPEVEPRELQPGETVLFRTASQGGPSRKQAVATCATRTSAKATGEPGSSGALVQANAGGFGSERDEVLGTRIVRRPDGVGGNFLPVTGLAMLLLIPLALLGAALAAGRGLRLRDRS